MPIPDEEFYAPDFPIEPGADLFAPWNGYGIFGEHLRASQSRFPPIRLYFIHQLLLQAMECGDGEVWELGVFRGESAAFLAESVSSFGRTLRLFDTFQGMPATDAALDWHKEGDFSNTNLGLVKERLKQVDYERIEFMKGIVPQTFAGLSHHKVVFAHVDLDIYWPIKACCEFIFPKLPIGGAMLFDDYGWATCPGARKAVDEYFMSRPEKVIALPTRQAFVVKICD